MTLSEHQRRFAEALLSAGPSVELGDRARDLDWLVGGWSAVVRDYEDDGSVVENTGEWWFAWVLEGRALQDVWISPERAKRNEGISAPNRYGSTIRYLDPQGDGWRIVWVNPVTKIENELRGERVGDRFVLEGSADSVSIRWSFTNIKDDSFTWIGESREEGKDWILGAKFILSRMQ